MKSLAKKLKFLKTGKQNGKTNSANLKIYSKELALSEINNFIPKILNGYAIIELQDENLFKSFSGSGSIKDYFDNRLLKLSIFNPEHFINIEKKSDNSFSFVTDLNKSKKGFDSWSYEFTDKSISTEDYYLWGKPFDGEKYFEKIVPKIHSYPVKAGAKRICLTTVKYFNADRKVLFFRFLKPVEETKCDMSINKTNN